MSSAGVAEKEFPSCLVTGENVNESQDLQKKGSTRNPQSRESIGAMVGTVKRSSL